MNDTRLVVQADNLTAGYLPGINILNGCTLEAYKGELIGIIGPNGEYSRGRGSARRGRRHEFAYQPACAQGRRFRSANKQRVSVAHD